MKHSCSKWGNPNDGAPIVMTTKDCSKSRRKEGVIGFLIPNNFKINTGDYLVNTGTEFLILELKESKPSKTYPGFIYQYAQAKLTAQPVIKK